MAVQLRTGDALSILRTLPDNSIHCVVTSPPYWNLRDYAMPGMIGMEPTWDEHVAALLAIFQEIRRVLRPDGMMWLNYGDSSVTRVRGGHARARAGTLQKTNVGSVRTGSSIPGLKRKDLMFLGVRLAMALQGQGWWVREQIIWRKSNAMPESASDRPARCYENLFICSKKARYFYDDYAVRSPVKQSTLERATRARSTQYQVPGVKAHTGESFRAHLNENPKRPDKQRGSFRPHAGFNDRWDLMTKEEQGANGARLKNVWDIAVSGFKGAHFATFAPTLAERCILLGTSAVGACVECGAPWKRILKDSPAYKKQKERLRKISKRGQKGELVNVAFSGTPSMIANQLTVGWLPTCTHDTADIVPCKILDPFAGAGTTGLVANRLGRDAVLIELNPAYVKMAKDRLQAEAPLFSQVISL